ncbi:MAG: trypsin-like peptidase domain-containing protein [Verrucomicrobiota bacterium]
MLRAIVAGGFFLASVSAQRPHVNDLKVPENRKDLEAIQTAVRAALAKAKAATVNIEIGEGSGTGVIVSADGLVLTAAHVSMMPNKGVTVVMEDGRKLKAKTLGLMAETDAGMLKITEPGPFPFVEVERGERSRLGDWVFALGHSGGFNKERGAVLRVGRIVRIAVRTMQSDCVLIGGDSGGPLFDLAGRLIGIHSRVGAELQVNNHVPVDVFVEHWEAMLKGEFIGEGPFAKIPEKGTGFLGFISEGKPGGGLLVTKVGEKTPAAEAGIKAGDVIRTVNGKPLNQRAELQTLMKELAPGEEIACEIESDGKPQTITFNVGER